MSLARELKSQSRGCEIVYIGHKGDNFDSFKVSGHDFDFLAFIKAGKFRRYHNSGFASGVFEIRTMALNIRDFFRLPGSIWRSILILKKFRPDVVFSKGGFVSVPVCAAARLLNIPIVTHDSDTVPGLANRIVARWAKVHATGMPTQYYPYPPNSMVYVGIPIDERIVKVTPKIQKKAKQILELPPDSQVLLVSGGGNGSQRLNELMALVAPQLIENNLALYIVHITGVQHEQSVKEAYQALPAADRKRIRILGYTNDFYLHSAAADLVLGRAGATTLAELAAAGKACILIPSPFLAGGHQLKNAEELQKQDAVVVAPENVEADELLALIKGLLGNDSRRFELARNLFATAKPDAAGRLAQLIISVANGDRL